jgi:hypothetical protein
MAKVLLMVFTKSRAARRKQWNNIYPFTKKPCLLTKAGLFSTYISK